MSRKTSEEYPLDRRVELKKGANRKLRELQELLSNSRKGQLSPAKGGFSKSEFAAAEHLVMIVRTAQKYDYDPAKIEQVLLTLDQDDPEYQINKEVCDDAIIFLNEEKNGSYFEYFVETPGFVNDLVEDFQETLLMRAYQRGSRDMLTGLAHYATENPTQFLSRVLPEFGISISPYYYSDELLEAVKIFLGAKSGVATTERYVVDIRHDKGFPKDQRERAERTAGASHISVVSRLAIHNLKGAILAAITNEKLSDRTTVSENKRTQVEKETASDSYISFLKLDQALRVSVENEKMQAKYENTPWGKAGEWLKKEWKNTRPPFKMALMAIMSGTISGELASHVFSNGKELARQLGDYFLQYRIVRAAVASTGVFSVLKVLGRPIRSIDSAVGVFVERMIDDAKQKEMKEKISGELLSSAEYRDLLFSVQEEKSAKELTSPGWLRVSKKLALAIAKNPTRLLVSIATGGSLALIADHYIAPLFADVVGAIPEKNLISLRKGNPSYIGQPRDPQNTQFELQPESGKAVMYVSPEWERIHGKETLPHVYDKYGKLIDTYKVVILDAQTNRGLYENPVIKTGDGGTYIQKHSGLWREIHTESGDPAVESQPKGFFAGMLAKVKSLLPHGEPKTQPVPVKTPEPTPSPLITPTPEPTAKPTPLVTPSPEQTARPTPQPTAESTMKTASAAATTDATPKPRGVPVPRKTPRLEVWPVKPKPTIAVPTPEPTAKPTPLVTPSPEQTAKPIPVQKPATHHVTPKPAPEQTPASKRIVKPTHGGHLQKEAKVPEKHDAKPVHGEKQGMKSNSQKVTSEAVSAKPKPKIHHEAATSKVVSEKTLEHLPVFGSSKELTDFLALEKKHGFNIRITKDSPIISGRLGTGELLKGKTDPDQALRILLTGIYAEKLHDFYGAGPIPAHELGAIENVIANIKNPTMVERITGGKADLFSFDEKTGSVSLKYNPAALDKLLDHARAQQSDQLTEIAKRTPRSLWEERLLGYKLEEWKEHGGGAHGESHGKHVSTRTDHAHNKAGASEPSKKVGKGSAGKTSIVESVSRTSSTIAPAKAAETPLKLRVDYPIAGQFVEPKGFGVEASPPISLPVEPVVHGVSSISASGSEDVSVQGSVSTSSVQPVSSPQPEIKAPVSPVGQPDGGAPEGGAAVQKDELSHGAKVAPVEVTPEDRYNEALRTLRKEYFIPKEFMANIADRFTLKHYLTRISTMVDDAKKIVPGEVDIFYRTGSASDVLKKAFAESLAKPVEGMDFRYPGKLTGVDYHHLVKLQEFLTDKKIPSADLDESIKEYLSKIK